MSDALSIDHRRTRVAEGDEQVTTTFDFQDGNGPVPAHQHSNGGGWVADTARVAVTSFVGPDARVSGNAWVSDNAVVSDNARVYGNARVSGDAWVSDRVPGSADISEQEQED